MDPAPSQRAAAHDRSPDPTAPRLHRAVTADGVSLALHRVGDPGGTPVLLAAGTFSNRSFWLGTRGTGFARTLAEHGFESWVLDFRGHGDSQRTATGGKRWNFDDWGRLDLPAAVHAIAEHGRRPLLVGHSAGGASVLAALAADPVVRERVRAAAILATPLPWLQRWRRLAAWTMRFGSRRLRAFPARLLRLGPEDELPGVMEQWMDWNLRGLWIGNDGTDYTVALRSLTTPLLFVSGAGDHRFAPPAATRGLYDLVGSPGRTYVLAGTATGFQRDYGHVDVVVSRPAREEIWPLLIAWLTRHAE